MLTMYDNTLLNLSFYLAANDSKETFTERNSEENYLKNLLF